jgi:hypothetical protein
VDWPRRCSIRSLGERVARRDRIHMDHFRAHFACFRRSISGGALFRMGGRARLDCPDRLSNDLLPDAQHIAISPSNRSRADRPCRLRPGPCTLVRIAAAAATHFAEHGPGQLKLAGAYRFVIASKPSFLRKILSVFHISFVPSFLLSGEGCNAEDTEKTRIQLRQAFT